MTATEAFENMLSIWTEQMNKCAAAENGYNVGRISLANYLEECFLLVYDETKFWGRILYGQAVNAASVLTRHWREFLEVIPGIKRRVLEHEGVDIRTDQQKMIIEDGWREAIDQLERMCSQGVLRQLHQALAVPFFEGEQDSEVKEGETWIVP